MATKPFHRNNVFKRNLPRFFQYLILSFITLIFVVPIVILVFGSLKTRGEMYSFPYTTPNPPQWDNYVKILSMSSFWIMLRNSLIVMLFSTAGVLIICSLAAFVFARMQFRGKDLGFQFSHLGSHVPNYRCDYAGIPGCTPNASG